MGLESGRDPSRVDRAQLHLVIKRAAELYAAESDSEDLLTGEEVLRIAAELGIPTRLARQALYELPDEFGEPSLTDRLLGGARTVAGRAVPVEREGALRLLEDYLVTREYLQVRRRRGSQLVLHPADDTISTIARAFRRSGSRHYLARSPNVSLVVRPLEPGISHVRLELDLARYRRRAAMGGAALGTAAGAVLGAGAAAAAGLALIGFAEPLGMAAGAAAGVGGFAGGIGLGIRFAAHRFRRRVAEAREEVEGLLDRLERGEPLLPPASPARRWLELRSGSRRS